MRIRVLVAKSLLLALPLTFIPTFASSTTRVTPGSICKINKQKVTYLKKTYTCIRSGKRLVWNKGVTIKTPIPIPVSTPIASPSPKPNPVQVDIDLGSDSRVTATKDLSKNDSCKTRDLTSRPDVSNGFPRPGSALIAPKLVKILILPVSFSDFSFLESDLLKLQVATKETSDIYKKISFDKLNVEFTFPEKSEWVTLARSAASYGIVENKPQQNNEIVVIDALAATSSKIDFDAYDGVLIESGWFRSTGGGQGFPGQRYPTSHGVAKGVSFTFGQGVASWRTIAHELGHSLFGLEDLYVFLNSNRPLVTDPTPAGQWDMMSNSAPDFFGWNKLLMGYLEEADLRCITNQSDTTHFISNINAAAGNKLVLINLSEGRTLALEARSTLGGIQGLLAYEIDSSINHGDGPIKAQKKLVEASQSLTLLGYRLEVIDSNKNGLLVRVTK
jgi:M6 family metalloprotease-like protein